ncbi:PorP/SprF family type IX secretion system membrane protein [Chitinophaga sancti]|uniref:PorP/SprF family type IX secretion system membrane protein n=1 Tax=Chitinophaga sancti TaxID=1004 RepID=UPI003F78D140
MSLQKYICLFLLGGLCMAHESKAQTLGNSQSLLEPSGTQYFQNQYLANPAMAGLETGMRLNVAYRRQLGGITGAPVTAFASGDWQVNNRVGVGAQVMSDKAGLIDRTRVAMTYAYRIPLGLNEQQLHFGLSAVWNVQRLDEKAINGNTNDPSIGAFNRRDNYFEAEFGMAYTDRHLNVQAALPNVRNLFTGNNLGVDGGGLFYTAVSYKFLPETDEITSIEPKLAYRGVKGYDNILDAGLNVSFLNNVANIMGMYHSSKSVTFGIGVNAWEKVAVQAMYTTQTGGIKTYVDGAFEIGATIRLFK